MRKNLSSAVLSFLILACVSQIPFIAWGAKIPEACVQEDDTLLVPMNNAEHMIVTEIEINATPEQVWAVLVDFQKYPDWNPFVRKIKGEAKLGAKLSEKLALFGKNTIGMKATVADFVPNHACGWTGFLLSPKVGRGHHRLLVNQTEDGKIRFVQEEKFDGVLVDLFFPIIYKWIRPKFEAMNHALKARIEQNMDLKEMCGDT
jgi:hypothetical protein